MSDQRQPLTVYYDGACPDCVEDRETYERMATDDANVHWYDITGKGDELRERGIDPERALRELHVEDASGKIHRELDAYQLLMRRAPRLRHREAIHYNRLRRHSTLGHVSPAECERNAALAA